MINNIDENTLDNICRSLEKCPICSKDNDGVMCWQCFKYSHNPYKEYQGTLNNYLIEQIKESE